MWYNSNWAYRKKITVDSSKVPSTQTNFPVLINITDTDLRDHAQSSGNDILFTNATGTKLNHEIDLWVNTTGQLVAWVNVTSLSSSADTILYMYYGNSDAADQQNVHGTWDENYVAVYHMNDVTTSTILDSTSNANHGTKKGANEPNQVDGKIGKAQDFNRANTEYINLGNSNDFRIASDNAKMG